MNTPKINVTPLIDVLLVLLIIFMIVAPIRPSSFQAKLPAEPRPPFPDKYDPNTLLVAIERNRAISLNQREVAASPDETDALSNELSRIFKERFENGDVDEQGKVISVVFIKAPRDTEYGDVVRVIDAVKQAGAQPIALQLDRLDQ